MTRESSQDNMIVTNLLFAFLVATLTWREASSTSVLPCKLRKGQEVDVHSVKVSGCEKYPCKLKKKTSVQVEMDFTPNLKVEPGNLRANVHALIAGVNVPFIEIDGKDVCQKVFADKNGSLTKVGCPLQKGQKYIYKDSFQVHAIYPKIKTSVHWQLSEKRSSTPVACFNVPVQIVD